MGFRPICRVICNDLMPLDLPLTRGQAFGASPALRGAMGQEEAEKLTATMVLQPGVFLPPRLPAQIAQGVFAVRMPPALSSHASSFGRRESSQRWRTA